MPLRIVPCLLLLAIAGCSATSQPGGGDAGSIRDMAAAVSVGLDSGSPDLTVGGVGCISIVQCLHTCAGTDTNCANACRDTGTPIAQDLLYTFLTCLEGDPTNNTPGECPHFNGGVCDRSAPRFDVAACSRCVAAAQAPGAPCDASGQACYTNCVRDAECTPVLPPGSCVNHVCR